MFKFKKEVLCQFKKYSNEMRFWGDELFFKNHPKHQKIMELVCKGIQKQAVEVFGNTRGLTLFLNPDEIKIDENEDEYSYEHLCNFLKHNKEILNILRENLSIFIKTIEKEKNI
jgi:uncharacterized protein YacL (UPF0231 family)